MTQTTIKAPKPKAAPTKPKAAATKKRPKPDTEDEASNDDGDAFEDESLLAATPPEAKKAKKNPAPKKTAGKPLADIQNEAAGPNVAEEQKPKKGKRMSEQYQKLTQLEHILKRPDTYIGSIEKSEKQMWVYNTELESMEFREVNYVPGLYKIFDEILVNAADNKQRDKNMDEMRITIEREKGEISVWNNGRGVPIEMHSVSNVYRLVKLDSNALPLEREDLRPRNDFRTLANLVKLRR